MRRVGEEIADQLEAFVGQVGHGRKAQVDERQVGPEALPQHRHGRGPVDGARHVIVLGQREREALADQGIVVDQQEARLVHPGDYRGGRRDETAKIAFLGSPFPPRVAEEILVDVQSLNFSYGRRPILKGISMRVPRGKVVAIMGASGSGKTTLLRAIGGCDQARLRVSCEWRAQDINKLDADGLYALRRRMSMLFQFGALFTDMDVFENVAFPLREHTHLPESMIRGPGADEARGRRMRGAHNLRPAELSGGMARRVALARAVVLDPSLVMYDEPFAGLDPIALAVIGRLVRKLNDALGATSIVVSHDVEESLNIVDYLYFISEGVIVGEGTPDEIRASEHPYIRQFVRGDGEGPVGFHYPARSWAEDVGLATGAPRA